MDCISGGVGSRRPCIADGKVNGQGWICTRAFQRNEILNLCKYSFEAVNMTI